MTARHASRRLAAARLRYFLPTLRHPFLIFGHSFVRDSTPETQAGYDDAGRGKRPHQRVRAEAKEGDRNDPEAEKCVDPLLPHSVSLLIPS